MATVYRFKTWDITNDCFLRVATMGDRGSHREGARGEDQRSRRNRRPLTRRRRQPRRRHDRARV